MAISDISITSVDLTNTFDQWRSKSNQLITVLNENDDDNPTTALLSANSMKGGMAILRPLLAETGVPPVGKAVIGTVKGDIHDIGKNLVGMMWEGAGFEVIDIGINNPVENYLEAIEEHKPNILGMSALLTTTMPYMKVVIEELDNMEIRDDLIVLVGGAPLNEEFSKAIGADAYCRDAAVAVETAKMMVEKRREGKVSKAAA